MSELNLQWVAENFNKPQTVLLNIGCADLTDDSLRFSLAVPNSVVYSFDCAEKWRESNLTKSKIFNLHYEHKAVSCYSGTANFYTQGSEAEKVDKNWQYTGTCTKHSTWNEETVEMITLNQWCTQHQIIPDFFHIDVEGEEYNVLKDLDSQFWPNGIWLEYANQYRNGNDKFVIFDVLDDLLKSRGYNKLYQGPDVLYVKNNYTVTPYTQYIQNKLAPDEHEQLIQQTIWLTRYNLVKDPAWPNLSSPKEFVTLPIEIQKECIDTFNLTSEWMF
jgi:FkbM family methyltransferase